LNQVIVRYNVTVADMADVMRRAVSRRRPRFGWRWRQSILVSALLTAFFASVIDGTERAKSIGSAIFFIVAFTALTYLQKARVSNALERFVREQYGPSAPFIFEIEITSEVMTTRQLGEEVRREWKKVERITEAPGGIEMDTHLGGMVFVRDSGFASPDERAEFLSLARRYSRPEATWKS
jgi:hypothetical protein